MYAAYLIVCFMKLNIAAFATGSLIEKFLRTSNKSILDLAQLHHTAYFDYVDSAGTTSTVTGIKYIADDVERLSQNP